MTQQVIERFRGEPLKFEGELIAQSKTIPTADGARWFQLELYRTADRHFVAATRLCTSVEGELPVTCAEQVEGSADVENFFFAFDPDEYLECGQVAVPEDQHAQFTADLYSNFEMAVRELLAELPTQEKESHVADAHAKERDDGALAG